MQNTPDNLKSRLSRLYVRENTFVNDAGKTIKYYQLVNQFIVNDEIYEIEAKLNKDKRFVLQMAQVIDKPMLDGSS